jgi:pectate lyase
LIDVTHNSDHITISWNYFHDHHKSNLVGSSNSDKHDRKITFHHNYYKNIASRTPSYRAGVGHVYNNLFEHITENGINTRVGACVKVEHNVFDDVKDPIFETGMKCMRLKYIMR